MCALDDTTIQKLDCIFKTYSCFDKTKQVVFYKNDKHFNNNNSVKKVIKKTSVDRELVAMLNKLNKANYDKIQCMFLDSILTNDNHNIIIPILLNSVNTNTMYIDLTVKLFQSIRCHKPSIDIKPYIILFVESIEHSITDPTNFALLSNDTGYENFCRSNKMKCNLIQKIKFCMAFKKCFPEFSERMERMSNTFEVSLKTKCNDIIMDITMQSNIIPRETLKCMFEECNWTNVVSPRIRLLLFES